MAALTVLFVAALMVGALMHMTSSGLRRARRWHNYDQCLLSAQTALEQTKHDIQCTFKDYFESRVEQAGAVSWFDLLGWFDQPETFPANFIGPSGYRYDTMQNASVLGATATVVIVQAVEEGLGNYLSRDLILQAQARMPGGVVRTVEERVRFGIRMTPIFDYSYFMNNFGYFWGPDVRSHGDIRANGDLSVDNRSTINGDVYAAPNAEIGAPGDVIISGGSWGQYDMSQYGTLAPSAARPMNPANADTNNPIGWDMGYNVETESYAHHDALEMPYLGTLSTYESYAQRYNGTIKQRASSGGPWQTLVTNVYSGAGPDNTANTPDDGSVVLIGTADRPIQVEGPVVVRGDVVIKGVVTGQGCIYAGRNIHVVGDVTYANPPSWPKPDNNPAQTAADNANRDLVGYAAKGNIILGNYTTSTWRDRVASLIRPTFTKPYQVDGSDAALGYDSDGNPANGYQFNGDYTANDGGLKKGSGSTTVSRKFYESSLADTYINSIASQYVERLDGVFYNNHAIAGTVGNSSTGFKFNGSMVARDDGIRYRVRVEMSWDIRLGSRSPEMLDLFFYFPQVLARPWTQAWREAP